MTKELNKIKELMSRIDEGYRQYSELITEGMSNILYHFTSIRNGFEMCKDDTIYMASAYAKDADNYDKKRKFYLSCTRMPSAQFGYSRKFMQGGVRVVLDGDLLSQRFKGKPVNYWGGGVFTDKYKYYEQYPPGSYQKNSLHNHFEKERYKEKHPNATEEEIEDYMHHNFSDAQWHISNESEDRIFSYEPSITSAHKYIISVDFLMPDIDENEELKNIAVALIRTPFWSRGKIRIYDSVKEFNNQGKPLSNDEITDRFGWERNRRYTGQMQRPLKDALKTVIQFIACGNPEYEGKNFGESAAKLLRKYELSEYSDVIGQAKEEVARFLPYQHIVEHLDSVRRSLSDEPNKFTSKVIKMLTDYFVSIGANSFSDAYKIKKQMVDDYYTQLNGNKPKDYFDNIDTNKTVTILTFDNYTLIPDPQKEKFVDLLNLVDYDPKYFANEVAKEVMEYHDFEGENGYTTKSKNLNSLYHYLYKLSTKGSIKEMMDALEKLGVSKDYIESYGIYLEYKNYNGWWDATNNDTLSTRKIKRQNNGYDYRKVARQAEEELYPLFLRDNNTTAQ